MRPIISSDRSDRRCARRRPVFWILLALVAAQAAPGCHHEAESHYTSVAKPQTVRLMQPQVRNIVRTVGQPSFTQSYERNWFIRK